MSALPTGSAPTVNGGQHPHLHQIILGNNGTPTVPSWLQHIVTWHIWALAPPGAQARDEPAIVCVICGGICKSSRGDRYLVPGWMQPMLVRAKPEYLEWQKQGAPLTKEKREDAELLDMIQVTEFISAKKGMKTAFGTLFVNTSHKRMCVPIHPTCLDVAQHFCKHRVRYGVDFPITSGGAPSSIAELYEIWCQRAIATRPRGPVKQPILEPTMYLGAPMFDLAHEHWHMAVHDPSLKRYLASPATIPNLTDIVVNQYLQTMDGKMVSATGPRAILWRRMQNMPQELFDRILDAMVPLGGEGGKPLPLTPTRVIPAIWWKSMLLSGNLIPWLWDLDEERVAQFRADSFYSDHSEHLVKDREDGLYVFDEDMWDWELLCRQLVQPNVLEIGGLLVGQSDRLWNRHRIWKLLDAARLGHVVFPPKQRL